jgi:hypothetical protein
VGKAKRAHHSHRLKHCGEMVGTAQVRLCLPYGLRDEANPSFVMRGLDPRIHQPSQESFEVDGLPGQARQ